MAERNAQYIEHLTEELLPEAQLAHLALDPAAQRAVRERVAAHVEASAQVAVLSAEAARQASQYEASGGRGGGAAARRDARAFLK
jgi:hypothetical protein